MQKSASAKPKTDTYRLQSLIRKLDENSQLPVVIFCFKRHLCENYPMGMSKLDLLSHDDRSKVHLFVKVGDTNRQTT